VVSVRIHEVVLHDGEVVPAAEWQRQRGRRTPLRAAPGWLTAKRVPAAEEITTKAGFTSDRRGVSAGEIVASTVKLA
jgi:hypothetical protein